jgi:predicted dehydrogenase
MEKVPCGVVGVGQLGQHHVRIYKELPQAELMGIYDSDGARMEEIAATHGTKAYDSLERLLDDVSAVSLVVPTSMHHKIGKIILSRGRHLLVEKPITETVEQGRDLIAAARDRGVILYTGHTERFAPALRTAKKWLNKPRYIEALRMAGFGLRGTDVSVIHDLMIHDIDLVLSTVDSRIEKVEAIGVPVFTPNVDIASARLSFDDGTIASLTASRVSIDRLRKMRFFQEDAYISVDFIKRTARIYKRKVDGGDIPASLPSGVSMQDLVEMLIPPVPDQEPLMLELQDFIASTQGGRQPEVTGEAGVRALEVVSRIIEDIEGRLAMWRG